MDYGTMLAGLILLSLLLALYLILGRRNPIHDIPGPPSPSWIFGHMLQLLLPPIYGDFEFFWQKSYGPVYRLKGCLGEDYLMISDPLAIQYVLNSGHFEHGPVLENIIDLLFGKRAVVSTKGTISHKRLRAAMNVGFSAAAVRSYQSVFTRVAHKLVERLELKLDSTETPTDVCPLFSNATLDAVSQAVLSYSTEDLGEEFLANNTEVVALSSRGSAVPLFSLGARLPKWIWRLASSFPSATFKVIRTTNRLSNRLGKQIVQEKLDAARQGLDINTDVFGMLLDRDHSDLKTRPALRLSAEEVAAQTAILLIAGQEITANTMVFGLLELARNPEFQEKLRAEIHSSSGTVSYDSCHNPIYLPQEVLRLYPAAALFDRIAVQDAVIPLTDSIETATGELMNQVLVRKGQILTLAVASYQRFEPRWGQDAHKFRPARWLDGTVYQGPGVGPYANLFVDFLFLGSPLNLTIRSLNFFGGPRVCLGWRFAILEMQVFFCELVTKFSFALPDSEEDSVRMRFAGSLIPVLPNGEKAAPLCITRI
ncbi:cytochrome P450 [Mycena leptocephala]|nr:cytochrome P450 [Mycena leptocephala]